MNAIDYMLKPVAKARLEKAIARVRRMVETSDTTSQKLDRLVQMVEQAPDGGPKRQARGEKRQPAVPCRFR